MKIYNFFTFLLNASTVRRWTTVVDASLWLVCVFLCVCRVVVAPAVELSVCCRFRCAVAACQHTHSQCCQLNSDWNLALPRFAKIHFHCFSAIFTIEMPKQQRFVYMTSHTFTHIQWHTHTQRALFWRSIERERERGRESARKRARERRARGKHMVFVFGKTHWEEEEEEAAAAARATWITYS